MQLLDGKALSKQIQEEIAEKVNQINGRPPHLAAILVGEDGASKTYVNSKVKACERCGFDSTLIRLEENSTEEVLLNKVQELNEDNKIDGFIVQLPLPKHIDEQKIISAINPKKDVDGFHPENFGKMAQSLPAYIPATPLGILELLKHNNIETSGKHCVVVGRSNIVGSPMSILMARNAYPGNCTVTLTHSRTQNLKEVCKTADILIVALGRPEMITQEYVKEGATVIDVGITRVEDSTKKRGYALKGDIHFESVFSKCSYITPVPGGVGPMTVTSLLTNTLRARLGEV